MYPTVCPLLIQKEANPFTDGRMWELGLRAIFSSTPASPAAAGDVERTAADHSSGLGAGSSGLGAEAAAAAAAAAEVAITINSNQHADAAAIPEEEEEEKVPFYVRPDGIPTGASVEAIRRHTLREQEVSARKWATSKTYEEVLAEWQAYCEAIAGQVLNGVTVRSDKVVWDATVTVSKAEEFQVEYLCQRVKKTGSGAGKERLSHSSCEKIQAGLIDLREQQIADDLLEEKFNRNEKGNDIKTANSIRALKLVKMRVKEEEQSFDLSSKIWKQVG